jgi:hypothetical protein
MNTIELRLSPETGMAIEMKGAEFKVIERRAEEILISLKKRTRLIGLSYRLVGKTNHSKYSKEDVGIGTVFQYPFSLCN